MKSVRTATLICALVVAIVPAGVASADNEEVYRFQGGGWGHGVGMSQYGAHGQALEGRTYPEILAHYYQGSGLGDHQSLALRSDALSTVPEALWVGLDQDQTKVTFEAVGGQLDLCQANDGTGPCPRPEHPQPGEVWTFERVAEGCRFFLDGAPVGAQAGDCRASISWEDATTNIEVNGREYAYGTIKLRSEGVAAGNFHVSLALDLEDYMRGIAEMPQDWPTEALKAQALAARTFAVYRFLTYERPELRTESDAGLTLGRKTSCWCHVRDSISDQVYIGFDTETGANSQRWLDAVSATERQVVVYEGPGWTSFTRDKVAGTFYFSSSAGLTETNVDGFGSSAQYPYLISVDDRWSADPSLNPNAYWEKDIAATVIASALGWESVTLVDLLGAAPGASVAFYGVSNGASVSVTKGPSWLRSYLKLPSPHILGLVGDPEGPPVGAQDPTVLIHPFVDLIGNPHERAIDTIWRADITTGCTFDQYCPGEDVARWQMALFLTRTWRLTPYDLPGSGGSAFVDLTDLSSEAQLAINQLAQMQISTGVSPTEFAPFGTVTRWQMALFLTRLVEQAGVLLPDGKSQGFTDLAGLTEETRIAINQLRQLGITRGTTDTTFSPDLPVRRDEMASFLSRALEVVTVGG